MGFGSDHNPTLFLRAPVSRSARSKSLEYGLRWPGHAGLEYLLVHALGAQHIPRPQCDHTGLCRPDQPLPFGRPNAIVDATLWLSAHRLDGFRGNRCRTIEFCFGPVLECRDGVPIGYGRHLGFIGNGLKGVNIKSDTVKSQNIALRIRINGFFLLCFNLGGLSGRFRFLCIGETW